MSQFPFAASDDGTLMTRATTVGRSITAERGIWQQRPKLSVSTTGITLLRVKMTDVHAVIGNKITRGKNCEVTVSCGH